jgi:mRNA-degrading endonuclease toxin of MazEF toxin-antitoxin module
VWWSESPDWGRRPVLILTRDEVIGVLTSVVTALVTTVEGQIPTEVALDESDGMTCF